jgi:hypothetical protein
MKTTNKIDKTTSPLRACASMIIEEIQTPDVFISFLLDAMDWVHSYSVADGPGENDKADPHQRK